MKNHVFITLLNILFINITIEKDLYSFLGIDPLNINTISTPTSNNVQNNQYKTDNFHKNKKISNSFADVDELTNFLELSGVRSEVADKIISRYLIAIEMKDKGCIFDRSGFDGLPWEEPIEKTNRNKLFSQKARSAANIFTNENKSDYIIKAINAEVLQSENNINGWIIYKVIMLGKVSTREAFVKVCVPFDDYYPAIVLEHLEINCDSNIKYIENLQKSDKNRLEKIKTAHTLRENIDVNLEKFKFKSTSKFNTTAVLSSVHVDIIDNLKGPSNSALANSSSSIDNNDIMPSFLMKDELRKNFDKLDNLLAKDKADNRPNLIYPNENSSHATFLKKNLYGKTNINNAPQIDNKSPTYQTNIIIPYNLQDLQKYGYLNSEGSNFNSDINSNTNLQRNTNENFQGEIQSIEEKLDSLETRFSDNERTAAMSQRDFKKFTDDLKQNFKDLDFYLKTILPSQMKK